MFSGATGGIKPDEIQVETVLSEEGQQVSLKLTVHLPGQFKN